MLLKSLHLHNIRSYQDQRIRFPPGTLMLSGDIGSGKSSILLAIEFCLFGFRPKVLDGGTLLRHGENNGHVELTFSLESKEYTIRRTLKRSARGIQQHAGFLLTDGVKKDLTPVELKAHILEILGYPADMLTRSKDQIFRYTVYTPQEEMKRIIMEDPESRLEVLRKVFNIDKYSKIKANAAIYVKDQKDKIKLYEGMMQGTQQLNEDIEKRKREKKAAADILSRQKPKQEQILSLIRTSTGQIAQLEMKLKELNLHDQELKIKENELKNIIDNRQRNIIEQERLNRQIAQLETGLDGRTGSDISMIEDESRRLQSILKEKEDMHLELQKRITGFETEMNTAKRIRAAIVELDNCPTCKQEVAQSHKDEISKNQDIEINAHIENIGQGRKQIETLKEDIENVRSKILALTKSIHENRLIQDRNNQLKDMKNRLKAMIDSQIDYKARIAEINAAKMGLNEKLKAYAGIEKMHNRLKEEHSILLRQERDLAIDINTHQRQIEGIDRMIGQLKSQIEKKRDAKKRHKELNLKVRWFEEFFMRLMTTMEQHVFNSIASEFDGLFREWVGMLIDEEQLQVRLDEDFTPVIIQNGYETEIRNLSGGEKTSIALAYRLALNKVINDLIMSIKTADLIILDEPTDGFSDYQLDKVREVFDELNIVQKIIVSHETKIESFVDVVIRVSKDEHISRISQ